MIRFGLILSTVVVALDQLTKWLALGPGKFSPPGCLEAGFGCRHVELSSFFDLSMLWNRGVSFGLLRADSDWVRWGLVAAMLAIASVFASWLRTAERRLTAIALGLVIGGALGNVIDRVRFGAVADFLDFSGPWFGWSIAGWPVGFPWIFNVADAAISVGAVLLAADMLLFAESEGQPAPVERLKGALRRREGGPAG